MSAREPWFVALQEARSLALRVMDKNIGLLSDQARELLRTIDEMFEPVQLTPAEINALRVAANTCRHCGGPVPCSSEFGDQRVGVRHSARSWKAMLRRDGTV